MEIEKIVYRKNKALVFYNGKEYEFSKEIVFKESLYEKRDISQKEFFEIKNKSDCLLAQSYLFNLLAGRLKSQREAENKLREKGFFSKAIKFAIDKALEYKLLDDDNYAKSYVNTHIKNKGAKMIRYELIRKGIDEETIDKYLEGTIDRQKQSALEHAQKYLKIKGEKATKDKLYKRLYSRGYDSEIIMETLSEFNELR